MKTLNEGIIHWHASGMSNGYAGRFVPGTEKCFSMERQMDQRETLTTNQEPADKLQFE
jgi:hypothetical protein